MTDKNMFSVFSVFNSNLKQLSFRLLLTNSQTIEELSIHVFNKSIKLKIDSKTFVLKFNDCIEINVNSLRQLKTFYTNCDQKREQNSCLNTGFTLSAEMSS